MHLVITIRKKVDPSNQLAIIVPIFDKKLGSNDDLYAKKLCSAFVQDVKFCAEKASLTAILLTLIGEISIKIGGSSSSKAQQLNDLFYQIQMQRNPEKSVDAYITEIRGIVQKKRHPWHFWKTPESFTRFEELVSDAFPLCGAKGYEVCKHFWRA